MNAIAQALTDTPLQGYGKDRRWEATLDLGYTTQTGTGRTVMKDMSFKGPLRVQRPFYPEGNACHTYLLHPPGGMVSGDDISINVTASQDSHVVLTTPSAGKIYHMDSDAGGQKQAVMIQGREKSLIEWLPQETILFNGANAILDTNIALDETARFVGWEMISYGRKAGNEPFVCGSLKQNFSISLGGTKRVSERFRTDPSLKLLHSYAGLNGFTQSGNLYWVGTSIENHRQALDDCLAELVELFDGHLVATHKPDVLIVRGFSHSAEELRNTFIKLWAGMRPIVFETPACMPRIWAT